MKIKKYFKPPPSFGPGISFEKKCSRKPWPRRGILDYNGYPPTDDSGQTSKHSNSEWRKRRILSCNNHHGGSFLFWRTNEGFSLYQHMGITFFAGLNRKNEIHMKKKRETTCFTRNHKIEIMISCWLQPRATTTPTRIWGLPRVSLGVTNIIFIKHGIFTYTFIGWFL